jgi:hypothetical protein
MGDPARLYDHRPACHRSGFWQAGTGTGPELLGLSLARHGLNHVAALLETGSEFANVLAFLDQRRQVVGPRPEEGNEGTTGITRSRLQRPAALASALSALSLVRLLWPMRPG